MTSLRWCRGDLFDGPNYRIYIAKSSSHIDCLNSGVHTEAETLHWRWHRSLRCPRLDAALLSFQFLAVSRLCAKNLWKNNCCYLALTTFQSHYGQLTYQIDLLLPSTGLDLDLDFRRHALIPTSFMPRFLPVTKGHAGDSFACSFEGTSSSAQPSTHLWQNGQITESRAPS